jgi:hypothetical protein
MKHERPALWSEPCADQNQSAGERSYTRFAAGRTTAISSSAVLSGRDWLAQHDRSLVSSPRLERQEALKEGRRKAHQQQRMQHRHQLATPLLRGVK